MERLTKKGVSASGIYKTCCVNFKNAECESFRGDCVQCSTNERAWDKLAAYEDTGLTPEQIKALTADKDEQAGTIMRLNNGLKKLRSSLQWLKETIHDLDYKAWAEDNIGKIDALLGGKEDG